MRSPKIFFVFLMTLGFFVGPFLSLSSAEVSSVSVVREISITDIVGLKVGNAQDLDAGTGVTVLLFDGGATVGVDISGGGPASRETPLASPITADNPIDAIVLSGGSAFGLAAGDGVMRWLEEHGVGFDTGFARVPLVLQSCLYDLGYGRPDLRPTAEMGRLACEDALKNHPVSGSEVGAGTGATVGKLYGMDRATKTGLGIYASQVGDLKMAAVVAVNALGDVRSPETGEVLAGLRNEAGDGFLNSCEELYKLSPSGNLFTGNTTIAAVVTNGKFSKAEMNKIASMARCAYARCISPVGTMADGDSIYAASLGDVKADVNVAGSLAAEVLARAIVRAAKF